MSDVTPWRRAFGWSAVIATALCGFAIAGVGIIASADIGGLSGAQAATQTLGFAVIAWPFLFAFSASCPAWGHWA